jgi:hypothetical protein
MNAPRFILIALVNSGWSKLSAYGTRMRVCATACLLQ